MSRKEVPRPGLVKLAVAGQITNAQGAQSAHLSIRQFQRLKARYWTEGIHGLCHRRRGQPSPRTLPRAVHARVAALLQSVYRDVNDCHATEKLQEVHGVAISRACVRRIRRALGLPAKHRRRPRPYRRRRSPALRMGALVLLDGSQFAWLETRGPTMTLLGAIDDATGTVVALVFRPAEDLHGYVTLLAQLAARHGLPLSLYGDRLSVFVRNDRHWSLDEELQGAQHPTQFGRILRELGIGYIPAGSPQAKGRIERLWRTRPDRLVVELRLAGVRTPEGATAFLPAFLADFNRRFVHMPASTSKRANASTVGCWSTAPGASAWPCSRGPAPTFPSGPAAPRRPARVAPPPPHPARPRRAALGRPAPRAPSARRGPQPRAQGASRTITTCSRPRASTSTPRRGDDPFTEPLA